ncbi:ribonuclease Z [Brevibacillus humidisoli]|uniref:ribonuclease Z n=1 Tax=Brevibacillus humidisoli TaxID=2895522 RepID=UPI001E41780D|nr:ribonuclease Z [Brevibacillus humidisoli]UFJ42979.1 ribonuclease Z [Brevibacillus humidisoli]
MIVTFLGTGSGAPTLRRNVSAIALWFIQRGKWWLFDCGEGTQQQIMRSTLKLNQLEKIFITHLHGDHLYGLIGLLASRSLRGGALSPVTVYGPPGLDRYIEGVMMTSGVHLQYPLKVEIVSAGRQVMENGIAVECGEVSHRGHALAYAVVEPEQQGAFRQDLAKQAGIAPGPVYGRLKRGETVQLPDGRIVHGDAFIGPPQRGRKLVYSGDTAPCDTVVRLAGGADLLIHEATFAHAHLELAERSGHSTALQAAQIADSAKVHSLILTHFSPRYDGERAEVGMAELLSEAQSVFPNTRLAADFLSVPIRRNRMQDNEYSAGSTGDEAVKV